MPKIFLSYRREDSAAYAGRLYDRLAAHFGEQQVFMDIDHIEPGEDFVEVIKSSVGGSSVLLLLIGRQWASVVDSSGGRRLENPDDFVRLELATALESKIRVIPVLLSGASMPRTQDLPEPLHSLARRQAIDIADTRFHSDVDRLIDAIERTLSAEPTQSAPAVAAKTDSSRIGPEAARELASNTDAPPVGSLDSRLKTDGPSLQSTPHSPATIVDAQTPSRSNAPALNSKLAIAVVCVVVLVVGAAVFIRWRPDEPGRQPSLAPERAGQATPARAVYDGPPVTLRAQDTFPTKFLQAAGFRALAEALNDSSAGKIKLDMLPAGAVVPVFATLDAVAKGTLDGAWVSPGYFYGKSPTFGLIDSPPFGPNASRYAQWRQDKTVDEHIDGFYRSFGVKSIVCGIVGPYADFWSTIKVGGPSDLANLSVRASGVRIEVFTKAGATALALPGGEITAAMQKAVIKAANFLEPASGVEIGLHDSAKFLYYPGAMTPAAGLDLIINAARWEQLSGNARAVIEDSCGRNVREMLDKNEARQRSALSTIAAKGVRVEPLPAPVVNALRAAWQKVAAEKSSDAFFAKLLDSLRPYERGGQ